MRSLLLLAALAACHSSTGATCPDASKQKLEMRSYVFALLKRGPAWTPEKTPESEKLFEGHMANIHAMADAGKLIIAGPFDGPDSSDLAGIFIFDAKTVDEVKPLLANDPAIAAGRLVAETILWYGPAKISYPGIVHP